MCENRHSDGERQSDNQYLDSRIRNANQKRHIAHRHRIGDRYAACTRPRQLDRYVLTLYTNEKVALM